MEYEGSTRIISLTPEAGELLRLEHAKHQEVRSCSCPGHPEPYSPRMVRRFIMRSIKEAGLDGVRFADLRHTCAHAIAAKWNGHERGFSDAGPFQDSNDTQNYAPYLAHIAAKGENKLNKASTEDLREAANILDNLLKF